MSQADDKLNERRERRQNSTGVHPIIFIRGLALGDEAIEATTATPFMGFNLGATKHRQLWTGEVVRLHFPSPLIRLMEDHGYRAVDVDADRHRPAPRVASTDPSNDAKPRLIGARSVIIHRYYDRADSDFVALDRARAASDDEPIDAEPIKATPPTIFEAAADLCDLIEHLESRWDSAEGPFGVHLVAHSMGGLIARCVLQHPQLKHRRAARAVNMVFTYATPHGGIALAGFEMPRLLRRQHLHHFHKAHLAELFQAPTADDLNGDFPTERFFCLVGTNHQDYGAGWGLAKRLAGPMSDGLVQINRAAVKHAPRAHVHRTHGGPFGIVNSEAGYNNLVRFLFGRLRLDAQLELQSLPLPPELQAAKEQGHHINASYWIEASLAPRPNPGEGERAPVYLTERRKANHSAIFRGYDELMHPERVEGADPQSAQTLKPRHPVLFSAFLDPRHSADRHNLVLSLELKVSATDYAIDGRLHPEYSLAGQTLYQDTLKLTFSPSPAPQDTGPGATRWALAVTSISQPWAEPDHVADTQATADRGLPSQAFTMRLTRGPQVSSTADPRQRPPRRDFQATLKLQLTHRGGWT